jgi:ABC-type phosphate/phosphonate transport system substrate-binding protein
MSALLLGAVAYDPKVVTIWDGFRTWLRRREFELDFVLYSNYERQVEDLIDGRIDVAWNSPLAWVRTRRLAAARGVEVRAVAMRDTDRDLVTAVVARSDSDMTTVADLRTATLGVGAVDSPQATLLPLSYLRSEGLEVDADVKVRRFDVGVGLHGDHIGGERQAATALMTGEVDAACLVDSNLLLFGQEGTVAPDSLRVIGQTAPYDHCNMTAGPGGDTDTVNEFVRLLLAMSYADAEVRPLLDLEGLRAWEPGRTPGYTALEAAVDEASFYGSDGAIIADDYRP